jgi:YjjW family glycine radical enzyme activase
MTVRGLVADCIEFSCVDGPGNRFVVFLQGCDFDCLACHNPYTINPCLDCMECVSACPSGALSVGSSGRVEWDESVCQGTDQCLSICRYDSTPKARLLTVADLMARIRRAEPFLSGVTVSGGEATLQAEFVHDLFAAIKADPQLARLTCFVDSNGNVDATTWDLLEPVMDAAMIDLKCLDPAIHRGLTGRTNANVLETIERLSVRGKLHEVRLLLVSGRNDADELLSATGRWLATIDPALRVKVIGFNAHGVRSAGLALREPTAAQRAHYAEVIGAAGGGTFTIEVVPPLTA